MRTPGRALAVITSLLVLAACSAGEVVPETVSPSPEPAVEGTVDTPGQVAEGAVATVVVPSHGTEIEFGIHPLVRAGDHVVLTVDLTPRELEDGDRVLAKNIIRRVNTFLMPMESPLALRLLDLERGVIMHGGTDTDDDPVVAPRDWSRIDSPAGTRLQMAFTAPPAGVASLALMVPGAPLVDAVPVVDGDVPPSVRPDGVAPEEADATGSTDAAEPEVLDLDAVVEAKTFTLESTTRELDGAVQARESIEMIEADLGSDVLFAFDSADLVDGADEVVTLVAERIKAREPGEVTVTGHTDDQGEDAYNQDLSERRARSVADALENHLDGAAHPLRAEGRGNAEPVVPNDSEENRARNRRVTVHLSSAVVTRSEVTTAGELPPWEGPDGTAGTPLRVDTPGGVWDLDATAHRLDGHVVVELAVTAVEDGYTSFLRSLGSHRGEGTVAPHSSGAGLTVLQGATRLHPLDYRTSASERWPEGEWLAAADLIADVSYDEGQTYVFTYVYPRLDVDEVTVQLGSTGRHRNDFRISAIPVSD